MIEDSDIVYVLSGGSANTDPDMSLGGDPSSAPVLSGLNNLFDNVSAANSEVGIEDYRCFYVFNNSLTETLWNANVYIGTQTENGAVAELGVVVADEIQKLTILGAVTGGSLTLAYDGDNVTFNHDSTLGTWGANLQAALRTIDVLDDVVVNVESALSTENVQTTVFTILYTGFSSGNRFQPILSVVSNDLDPAVTVTTARVVGGSPINSIAPLVDRGTTQPTGVEFYSPTESEPFPLGDLRPTDGFPVWLKRTTPAGTAATADDGIAVICTGTAFE